MIKYNILVYLFLLFWFNACSTKNNGDHIVLKLDNQHLKDTPAGFWLNDFDIDYSINSERFKKQVSDIIVNEGELIDGYFSQDNFNEVETLIYQYKDYQILIEQYKDGIWKGPKVIPFQEYHNGGLSSWITIKLKSNIPYAELIPNKYKDLNPNREYEHSVTIESQIDQERRLFLFGSGLYCERITLH
tara:strand:+ start:110 stop:673 length:564 start_codon:yes stop_codon:yes gene_type:complete